MPTTFFADFIRAIFTSRPEILSSSEKNISFKDLHEVGSIDEMRKRIIDREVENIMRGSHSDQLAWIDSRLKTTLSEHQLWPSLVEIFERRNLITHTNAQISLQYLSICRNAGVDVKDLKVGDRLTVSSDYLKKSTYSLIEFGLSIVYNVWRHLNKDQANDAANALNEIAYEFIVRKQYSMAINLLAFAIKQPKKELDKQEK